MSVRWRNVCLAALWCAIGAIGTFLFVQWRSEAARSRVVVEMQQRIDRLERTLRELREEFAKPYWRRHDRPDAQAEDR